MSCCEACKISFEKRPDTKGRFCSYQCYWKNLKGKPPSEDTTRLLKEFGSAHRFTPGHTGFKGFLGKKHKPETREVMRTAKLERPNRYWSGKKRPDIAPKISAALKGRRLSPEQRRGMSARFSGRGNPAWKGGVTPEHTRIRNSNEYACWRKAVFERDNYTCVICGAHGVTLHADHIKRFAEYPHLRLDTNNGRTLCVPCHKATPTWGYQSKKVLLAIT